MQEIGLNKGEFNESSVEKMSKELQPLYKGIWEKTSLLTFCKHRRSNGGME